VATNESKTAEFAEDLGKLLSTAQVKAQGWLEQRTQIAKTLESIDLERPLQPLWAEFDALARVPLMVIRGANSDVLAPATVAAMRARRAQLDAIEVPDQGHAPLLREHEIMGRISSFIAHCERSGAHTDNARFG